MGLETYLTFHPKQMRCDLTVCNSMVTLEDWPSFGGALFKGFGIMIFTFCTSHII